MKGVIEAILNAYRQNWNTRENKKSRYNPEHEQEARGGGGGGGGGVRDCEEYLVFLTPEEGY